MAKPRRKSLSLSKSSARSTARPKAAVSRSGKASKPAARKGAKPSAKAKPAARPRVTKAAARPKAQKGTGRPKAAAKVPVAVSRTPAGAAGAVRGPRPAQAATPPPQRSTYAEALGVYVRGIQALQARKYREAADLLRSVISRFPEEKELHERATLYVRVCERQIAETPAHLETAEDRVYAATVALNNGAVDRAISLLLSVVASDDSHDQAAYMLGVAYAIRGQFPAALQYLGRSMALNPENRALARKEPDLEALRRTDEMRALLSATPAQLPARDKRPARKRRK